MNELALFAGAGGGLLATKWFLGWKTVCYVEWDEYCIDVLKARIADKIFDDAPIWDDVQTFDGYPWAGCVDIITGGFPCQPFSGAGKQLGESDPRNMWPATIRVIREVCPEWVLLENVPNLRCPRRKTLDSEETKSSYFGRILSDLAESGYDVRWKVLSAAEVGAPHKRDRVFIVAYTKKADDENNRAQSGEMQPRGVGWTESGSWSIPESSVSRVAHGVANRCHRLEAIGNGQVPLVVSTVWNLLTGKLAKG